MAAATHRRRNLLGRRRRLDEGEDEDDGIDDGLDDSMSDVTNPSDDNLADDSDLSETDAPPTEHDASAGPPLKSAETPNGVDSGSRRKSRRNQKKQQNAAAPNANQKSVLQNTGSVASLNATSNGLKTSGFSQSEETANVPASTALAQGASDEPNLSSAGPAGQPTTTTVDRKSRRDAADRDGQRHPKAPAVPHRGGFFMHDSRHQEQSHGGQGFPSRGRGRGRGGFGDGVGPHHLPVANNARWDHDLHDAIVNPPQALDAPERSSNSKLPALQSSDIPKSEINMNKTITVATVTVRVFLPPMQKPIMFERMPVKQHTRLPDLRPPLRRDKPVRISLPDNPPRYIFPSPDRSFIFIPRAQRPNQAGRNRSRGYLSQFGSRRTSIHGAGSNHSPSIAAMSRRSSIARSTVISPAASTFPRPPFGAPTGPSRPVVKLPNQIVDQQPAFAIPQVPQSYPLPSQPTYRESNTGGIPMHQPRPQKQVSVAGFESSNQSDNFQAPQQQEQQPFHHQVPASVSGFYPPSQGPTPAAFNHSRHTSVHEAPPTGGTPLSNIPERALNAMPFQPSGMVQPAFYPPQYQMQPMFYYPQPDMQASMYGMAPHMMYPGPGQGGYMIPVMMSPSHHMQPPDQTATPAQAPEQQVQQSHDAQPGMVAHESNGMVFYYPSQYMEAPQNYQAGADGFYYQGTNPQSTMYYPTNG